MFQETQMPTKMQSWHGAAVVPTQPDRNIKCGFRKCHLCAQTTPGFYCMSSIHHAHIAEKWPKSISPCLPLLQPTLKGVSSIKY